MLDLIKNSFTRIDGQARLTCLKDCGALFNGVLARWDWNPCMAKAHSSDQLPIFMS